MSDGLYAALSGAMSQTRALEVVANNLANVTTTGFKADRVSFRDTLASAEAGTTATQHQVEVSDVRPDLRDGVIRDTGGPLDVAILGPGFFAVETSRGTRYTRNGAFTLSPQGVLSTADGQTVLGTSGRVVASQNAQVHIDAHGLVHDGGQVIGQLRVVDIKPSVLLREGLGLWNVKNGETPNRIEPSLQAGAVEQSNVNAIQGMSDLVLISRAYESYNRAIEMFRAIDQKTSNDLGR